MGSGRVLGVVAASASKTRHSKTASAKTTYTSISARVPGYAVGREERSARTVATVGG